MVAHALDAAGMRSIAWTPNKAKWNIGLLRFSRRRHSAILPTEGRPGLPGLRWLHTKVLKNPDDVYRQPG